MSNVRYVEYALSEGGERPFRKYDSDAGWDLVLSADVDIHPGETTDVHTGLYLNMPNGIFGRITGRSSTMRKHGLLVNEGIVDSGYTGEMLISVRNLDPVHTFHAKRGMRLAQVIFQRTEDIRLVKVDRIDDSDGERNQNGFGSTGL